MVNEINLDQLHPRLKEILIKNPNLMKIYGNSVWLKVDSKLKIRDKESLSITPEYQKNKHKCL